ncbi:MAG: transcriptional regulator [archaeon GB-1845-036]|nr:transcriptional regulator [Candidatus Culexmicrobium thermophilum]RLE57545.1 MAG: transcriptional regulator [Candidatus Verstraetearchaeota archaeon]HDO20654.1 transcriptional regulator [Candidatus Bathyarchaeota archaeon]
MGFKKLEKRLERIEYLLEYLSREIETIKGILGLAGEGILAPIEGSIRTQRVITESYRRILSLEKIIREGRIKDKISREILRILVYIGPMNISQITRELKKRRGRASRRIVSEKLRKLKGIGIIELEERGREKVYRYVLDRKCSEKDK